MSTSFNPYQTPERDKHAGDFPHSDQMSLGRFVLQGLLSTGLYAIGSLFVLLLLLLFGLNLQWSYYPCGALQAVTTGILLALCAALLTSAHQNSLYGFLCGFGVALGKVVAVTGITTVLIHVFSPNQIGIARLVLNFVANGAAMVLLCGLFAMLAGKKFSTRQLVVLFGAASFGITSIAFLLNLLRFVFAGRLVIPIPNVGQIWFSLVANGTLSFVSIAVGLWYTVRSSVRDGGP